MERLRKFLRLTTAERWLFIKVSLLLEVVKVGMWIVPFRTLFRLLSRVSRGPKKLRSTDRPSLKEIARAVEAASRRTPGVKTCLTQALVAQLLLARRGYPALLHLGVTRGEQEQFQAHAWVESEDRVVIGGGDLERYTPLGILKHERSSF